MKIEVYSDGSATTSDKPGGWGYVLVADGIKMEEGYGHMEGATNNDAELMGAVQALLAAFKFRIASALTVGTVTLVSDSQIVLGWASGRYKFKQLAKMDQYKKLMMLVQRLSADTRWVEGHTGDEHNERCDVLANAGRLNTMPGAPKAKKTKKIGKRVEGVVGLVCLDGRKKLVDLVHNICQDYNEAEHGIREVWVEVKEKEGFSDGREDQAQGTVQVTVPGAS